MHGSSSWISLEWVQRSALEVYCVLQCCHHRPWAGFSSIPLQILSCWTDISVPSWTFIHHHVYSLAVGLWLSLANDAKNDITKTNHTFIISMPWSVRKEKCWPLLGWLTVASNCSLFAVQRNGRADSVRFQVFLHKSVLRCHAFVLEHYD